MNQFAIQLTIAQSPSATARMRLLNNSPSITHITGPQEKPKAKTNRLAANKATTAAMPTSWGAPFTTAAPAKTQLIEPRVRLMTTEPINSSGLRPMRSMNRIATNVVTTLVSEVITVTIRLSVVLKPTACQRTLE